MTRVFVQLSIRQIAMIRQQPFYSTYFVSISLVCCCYNQIPVLGVVSVFDYDHEGVGGDVLGCVMCIQRTGKKDILNE